MELRDWMVDREERIAALWLARLRSREGQSGDGRDGLLGFLLSSLVVFLSRCLGGKKDLGEEVWHQATYLYGSLALRRALSAGEVVEELGILREILLKLLLKNPADSWESRSFQRDLLTLNRLLDQGVVRASVAYVDDLFFAHLQGSGIPEGVTPDLVEETRRQLEGLRADLDG